MRRCKNKRAWDELAAHATSSTMLRVAKNNGNKPPSIPSYLRLLGSTTLQHMSPIVHSVAPGCSRRNSTNHGQC
eukprot:2614344-Lingulodinium_polyedra.AAC.1